MDKHPIPLGAKVHATRRSLAALAVAVTVGAMTTVASGTPSMAQIAGTQFGVADHSLVDNVAYVGRGGGVYRGRMQRRAYVGRRGYGYRGGGGYGVGAGVAGAAVGAIIGGALAAPYYQQPYGYDQQPYGYYQQPYGYGPGYY